MQSRREIVLGMAAGLPFAGCATSAAQESTIDERFVRIGGINQWLSVRGASAEAPLLLFLHGGPGEAMSPFASMLAPWEAHVTVALWDQRGAGRTYGANQDQGEMSLTRLTADTIELAEHLRQRFGRDKIVLCGYSWGSVLGWTAIRARPDLFSAYVGTGQAISWARSIASQETYARAQASAAGDEAALSELEAAQRLPITDFARTAPLRRWIMSPADRVFLDVQRAFVGTPPFPDSGPVAEWVNGFTFSAQALSAATLSFDAYGNQPVADLPVVFIQGEDDHVTPTEVVSRFAEDLRAPAKRIVTIPGGHFACYTNAQGFSGAIATHVRPLLRRR